MSTLTSLPLTTLNGDSASLSDYAGKVLLIVNVASKCGFTPQYTALEALYRKYKDQGFAVLGFPANDFGEQEPGTDQQIATFCSTEYPVTFPIFSKLVATGPSKSPLYAELIAAKPEPTIDDLGLRDGLNKFLAGENRPPAAAYPELLWNFEKFLVGRDGTILARYATSVVPDDARLTAAIEAALAS